MVGNRDSRRISDAQSRRVARVSLGVFGALLGGVVMVGPSFGQGIVEALQTGSPTPTGTATAGPSGPSIAFLNPAASYDPDLPRPPGAADPPKLSDRNDGIDRAYHLVAAASSVPANPIVEAYILYPNQNEATIGVMDRVPGSDTWELFWDIPDSFPEGRATLIVRLYLQTPAGIEEVASHELAVDVQHKGEAPDPMPADETVEITWPTQNGELGFFRGVGTSWATVVDVSVSEATSELDLWYSTTAPGQPPEFKLCGHELTFRHPDFFGLDFPENDPNAKPFRWQGPCTLQGNDSPSAVTAIAAVTQEADKPGRGDAAASSDELTQDSGDVHRVGSIYIPEPAQMKIEVLPNPNAQQSSNRRRTAGPTTGTGGGCLAYLAFVTDHLDRPVQGANVDIDLQGPGDQIQFGDESTGDAGTPRSGPYQAPDKGNHPKESGRDCDPTGNSNPPAGRFLSQGEQGDHNIPGGADIKHRESAGAGTGAGDAREIGLGMWRFNVFSEVPGMTDITAWIDSESASDESKNPVADDDIIEPTEPFATHFAQWYSAAPVVDITPLGGVGATGECFKYTAKVRSGNAAVPRINIDIHAKGPDDALDFCDPEGATPRRAPDRGPAENAGPHQSQDGGEASHVEAAPRTQHTEGETDREGNFVFGLRSTAPGDTTITAWVDGETEFREGTQGRSRGSSPKSSDDDVQGGSEPNRTVNHSWVNAGEARISFVNPSGYGGSGDNVARKADADSTYHLVARVQAVAIDVGVEFHIASSASGPFTKIGDGVRIGTTDTYHFNWNVDVADGTYTLRAQTVGASASVDRTIVVNNTPPSPPNPQDVPFETAEITSPELGSNAGFSAGKLSVSGVASTGADGVDLFYTKVSGRDTPGSAQWILCGFVDLAGGAAAPQGFKGECSLTAPDQPSQVTGVAAVAVDCIVQNNCDASIVSGQPRQANRHSGDAHRVFGLESNPLVSIEPAESQTAPGGCQRLVLSVSDQTGQPMSDANVDVHATGPSENIHFCNPEDGSNRRAPDQGGHSVVSDEPNSGFHQEDGTHHTEGNTGSGGRFVFGITSPNQGDTQLLAWVDVSDDDTRGTNENSDTSIVHWGTTGGGGGCTVEGTDGNDRLVGTDGNDVICGRGGDDTIIGEGGNDVLIGNSGRDILTGGPGDDVLRGGSGPDTLIGGAGDDRLVGASGADVLRGAGGSDVLKGGIGRDTLKGGASDDTLKGGRSGDDIDGGRGQDSCQGGPGRDRIRRCEGSRTGARARAL